MKTNLVAAILLVSVIAIRGAPSWSAVFQPEAASGLQYVAAVNEESFGVLTAVAQPQFGYIYQPVAAIEEDVAGTGLGAGSNIEGDVNSDVNGGKNAVGDIVDTVGRQAVNVADSTI